MYHALWQSVLGEIELTVSHATFTTWFKNTELINQDNSGVVISVPNIFAKKQFEVKFNDQVKNILKKNGVNPKTITYAVNLSGKHTQLNRNRETTVNLVATQNDNLITNDIITGSKITPSNINNCGLNPRYTFDKFCSWFK
jgi:chromosomal replication initiator protein